MSQADSEKYTVIHNNCFYALLLYSLFSCAVYKYW